MRRYACLCMMLAVCITAAACGGVSSKNTLESIKNKLLTTKSYSCEVLVEVTNNKSTAEYRMKHLYKAPDKYRIEVVEPDGTIGQTTVFSGDIAYVYHPDIKTYLKLEGFQGTVEHDAFVGAFICYFKQLEKAKVDKKKVLDKEYYILELEPAGDNRYMRLQRLWVDASNGTPAKMEILDKDNNTTVLVTYSNFDANTGISDNLFEIQ